jgi:hypothetical protein
VIEGVECSPRGCQRSTLRCHSIASSNCRGGAFFRVQNVLMGVCSAHTAASNPSLMAQLPSRRDADDPVSAPAVVAQAARRPGTRFTAESFTWIAGDIFPFQLGFSSGLPCSGASPAHRVCFPAGASPRLPRVATIPGPGGLHF